MIWFFGFCSVAGVDELNRGGEIWGQKMMSSIYLKITGKLRMVTVGKGHDMGMSLYGANALAEKQITAATILSYYYPGTKVVTPDLPQAK